MSTFQERETGRLSSEELETFHRQGYLVLPGFFRPEPLLERARELVSNFDVSLHPMTKFTTGDGGGGGGGGEDDGQDHVGDRYFLESGDKVRHFFEEGAFDPVTNRLVRPLDRSINKVGHALHVLDPVFSQFSFQQKVVEVARSLSVHSDPKVLQSMIICKQPSIGGAVPPHNDSTFLYTDPPSALGFWFALEDCSASNGCLSFLPGSHRWPKLGDTVGGRGTSVTPRPRDDGKDDLLGPQRGVNKRFVRKDPINPDAGTHFEILSEDEEAVWDDQKAVVEECPAGTLVLIHGSVLHKSEKNLSERSRYIYTYHMIEGDESKAKYDSKNWLQPTEEMPFQSLYRQ
ncbi:phytanoyl-CoA dioxygenase [Violaceomyces palustris]|uniref:Phytanoyl-CoA dioxygenase n=1 Tax=Violaceomyces palustris TaxID=1673888 RepID=A0ACD0P6I2_9BASI|nr:phytanoyl-CoA dioxygenase [Violaceomyces palustris]